MKVKALRDIAGGYGFCKEGEVMNISEGAAKELADVGLVEIVGEAKDEPEQDSEEQKQKRGKGVKNAK